MSKTKDFQKMCEEYEKSIHNINELIEKYKRDYGIIQPFNEIPEQNNMLKTLLEEKEDLIRIYIRLKNYYDDDFVLKECV